MKRSLGERIIKRSGRYKMAIGVAVKFLNIVGDIEARNRKRVPQATSTGKKTY